MGRIPPRLIVGGRISDLDDRWSVVKGEQCQFWQSPAKIHQNGSLQ
jgi:hypothetical protein